MKQLLPQTLTHLTMVVVLSTLVIAQPERCATVMGYQYFIEDVMENTPVGTDLGVLPVIGDESEVILTPTGHDFFQFIPTTRTISLIKRLSVDRGAAEIKPLFINCQTTSDNARAIDIEVTILVIDYNNNAPTFNSEHHNTSISEDAKINDVVYDGAIATDNDKPYDRNSQVIYSIIPGRFSTYFKVESGTSPVITLANLLDYEQVTQMIIELKARDRPPPGQPQHSSTATVTVNILDADDLNPAFTRKTYDGSIPEDAEAGTFVTVEPRVVAEDQDTMKVPIVYRLLDPYGMFNITETTGKIYKTETVYEGLRTVTVVAQASQVGTPQRQGYALVRITITEANIHAPKFTPTLYEVTVSEYEPVGSTLVTTTATDIDFGTVLEYSLVEDTDDVMVDNSGNIILLRALDYEVEREKTVRVKASDGSHAATATVQISIADVNDNNPVLTIPEPVVSVNREQGLLLTTVSATDADVDNVIRFVLGTHHDLFTINAAGEIYITAQEEELLEDEYSLLVLALDDPVPPRQAAGLLKVKFPPSGITWTTEKTTVAVAAASIAEADNMLTIILGAVAGALAVVIVILIVYICWKNRRTKEELDKARLPHGHAAKGLTYRQAEPPDDLPKMDLRYAGETDDSEYGGSTTIQENPFRASAVNDGYLQSSGSEMDRDVSEIEIETAVVPYDEEDFGYPSGRPLYINSQHKTFRGGEDSTSTESSQSDSTGGSRRGLVHDAKQNSNKMTSWDSDDKLHPQGAQKLLNPGASVTPKKPKEEKPSITVYF